VNSNEVNDNSQLNILLVELGSDIWTAGITENLQIKHRFNVFGTGTNHPDIGHKFSDFLVRGNPHESGLDLTEDIKNFTIDKHLYAEINCFEGATLRMLDRVDGFRLWQRNDLSKRRSYVFREASFWSYFLEEKHIDAVVFANIPHEVHDFIIYNLCKARNIPTLIFFHTFNVDTFAFTISESVEAVGGHAFPSNLKSSIKFMEPVGFRSRLRDDFLGTGSSETVENFGVYQVSTKQQKDAIDKPVLAQAKKAGTRERIISKLSRIRSNLEYVVKSKSSSLPRAFVFFPLHVEPELAISPSGGHFEEQFEAVRFVASKLPCGWKVVVKEHPHQRGFGPRPIGFYKRFEAIPNVEFVKTELSSLELIAKSQAVATITGSAGIEAVRLGKPSWVLGYPWYLSAPGVSPIDTSADLEQAYADLNSFDAASDEVLDCYVDELLDSHFYGFIPGIPYHALSEEREYVHQATTENVVAVIAKWISNKFQH
jgi:hypothetical protein